MVVHDLDLRRAFRRPDKAHAELVVDPDRVLPLAIAPQRLETVAWRRPQVTKIGRGVEVAQFPARHLDQIGRTALRTFAVEDGFGALRDYARVNWGSGHDRTAYGASSRVASAESSASSRAKAIIGCLSWRCWPLSIRP